MHLDYSPRVQFSPASPQAVLASLLSTLFTVESLRIWVAKLPRNADEYRLLMDVLPSGAVPLSTLAMAVADALVSQGYVDADLHERLCAESPRRVKDIEEAFIALRPAEQRDPLLFFALGHYKRLHRILKREFKPSHSFVHKHAYKPRETLTGYLHTDNPGHGVIVHHTPSNGEYIRVFPAVDTPSTFISPRTMHALIDGYATLPEGEKRFLLYWCDREAALAPILALPPNAPAMPGSFTTPAGVLQLLVTYVVRRQR